MREISETVALSLNSKWLLAKKTSFLKRWCFPPCKTSVLMCSLAFALPQNSGLNVKGWVVGIVKGALGGREHFECFTPNIVIKTGISCIVMREKLRMPMLYVAYHAISLALPHSSLCTTNWGPTPLQLSNQLPAVSCRRVITGRPHWPLCNCSQDLSKWRSSWRFPTKVAVRWWLNAGDVKILERKETGKQGTLKELWYDSHTDESRSYNIFP